MLSSSKATVAFAILFLGTVTNACLFLTGSYSTGFRTVAIFDVYDNGVHICDISSGDQNGHADCREGYSLKWDLQRIGEPVWVSYSTPHGTYDFYTEEAKCDTVNCCGGALNVPCMCHSCRFGVNKFCPDGKKYHELYSI